VTVSLLAPTVASPPAPGPPPTFSVIIAAYQVAPYLAAAIESALGQSYPAREVIVCDDGSTDEIDSAIAPYLDRIRFIRQENRGVGAAKNAAAGLATGDFIAILDGDDVYKPDRLEKLAEASQQRPDLDILTTDAEIVLDGKVLRRAYDETWAFEVGDQRRTILERCFVIGHAAMRREPFVAAGGFDETLRAVDDWDLWIRMILRGSRAGLVEEPLAEYRIRQGSISTKRVPLIENALRILEKAAATPGLSPAEERALRRTRAAWRRDLRLAEARSALQAGLQSDARRHLAPIVLGWGYAPRTRLKAAVSLVSPGRAGSMLAQRERQGAEAAAGVRIGSEAEKA
jgi:GT2 family glycosyltransferase